MNLPISTTDPIIVAWVAGILEGEGCFDVHKGVYPRIRVKMGDKDVIDRISKLWKCRTAERKDNRPRCSCMYEASVTGDRALQWMRSIFALMGERRRAKILEIMQAYETSRNAVSGEESSNLGRKPRKKRSSSTLTG